VEAFRANCGKTALRYGAGMEDRERDEAVEAHLSALDDEIARLRKMEEALDRRIEAAEEERQAIEDATRPPEDG
jgi:chromosome segregation ATPase